MTNSSNYSSSDPPCYIFKTNETLCYCPKDFYGNNCEYENSIDCTMNYQKPNNCPNFNNDFYVSDYGGDAPCHFVKKNDLIIIRLF